MESKFDTTNPTPHIENLLGFDFQWKITLHLQNT